MSLPKKLDQIDFIEYLIKLETDLEKYENSNGNDLLRNAV